MLLIAAYFSDIAQVALTIVAVFLMAVSLNAYRRRAEGRYFALAVAFISLCGISTSTLVLEFYVGLGPDIVQIAEMYLIPALELVMVGSFLVSLLWSSRFKRLPRVITMAVILGIIVAAAYASTITIQSGSAATCAKPSDGFLIVVNSLGFNNSAAHGAPAQSWPILSVPDNSDVVIAVCNSYQQPVGFQVAYYLQNPVERIQPGQTLMVSFTTNQTGTFDIYCDVFSSIHLYLQSGELVVT